MDVSRTRSLSADEEQGFDRALEQFRTLLNQTDIDAMQPLGPGAVYTSLMTVWLLVYQRLHAGCTLEEAGQNGDSQLSEAMEGRVFWATSLDR